jgi:TnsA endonuclease N terminal
MARAYRQGFYKPVNPQKYAGDPTNIVYRSSYELKFMKWLDLSNSCIKWSSEETIVMYRSPVDDKIHRYFVDFQITLKQADGSLKSFLVEVKPFVQTQPPKNTRNKRALMEAVATYQVNQAKWDAAKKHCQANGLEFKIITEYELGIKSR